MRLIKPPFLIKKIIYPGLHWKVQTDRKEIFLTFDDGPHPEITPKVLEILDKYEAKATFFCVGENVKKYPEIYRMILSRGHQTGNHTFNHLKGWNTPTTKYAENVYLASTHIRSSLFRPPHGRIKRSQLKILKQQYHIIMWSVLTYDWDSKLSGEQCLSTAIQSSKAGSIVVFHDSLKAKKNMLYALPRFLEHFTEQDYQFFPIDPILL
ncbi:MAG: polysaccharide deacetylase family protein [Bacteroidales bacterium]|nr:polysaccharide deacetylase family protein [Bacteroidales bacterium]